MQDYREAVKWVRFAAEQGHAQANCDLAEMYAEGSGIKKDLTTAKRLAKEGLDAGEQYCWVVWNKYSLASY